jgi:murein DD-endopeptidase MepM/ murein hydrolase activator NlpD
MKNRILTLLSLQFFCLIINAGNFSITDFSNFITDSSQTKRKTTPFVSRSVNDSILEELFTNDKNFMNKWNNEALFVYWDAGYNIIPDTLELPLLKNDEKFFFNWKGNLFSGYGPRGSIVHRGLDIDLKMGDTIVSSFDGVVRYARFNEGGYGNCVIVRHLNGLETLYGHMSNIIVKENQFVKAGNVLGLCGSTGKSDGPHLHFETRYKDFSFDPYLIIDRNTQKLIDTIAKIDKKKIDEFKYSSNGKNPALKEKEIKSNRKIVKKSSVGAKKTKSNFKGKSAIIRKKQTSKSKSKIKKTIKTKNNKK